MWPARLADKDSPQAVFARHHLKGAKEQGFSEVLSGSGFALYRLAWADGQSVFYAIGMLAYNVLTSLKVLDLPDEAQGWRIRSASFGIY